MKKFLIIAGSIVVVLCVIIYLFMFYEPSGMVNIRRWDPFYLAYDESFIVLDTILEPLYPDISPLVKEPDPSIIALYFLNNDFTNELKTLSELYQNAIKLDQNASDQRDKAKKMRMTVLAELKKNMDTILGAIEVAQKHADEDIFTFTPDEEIQLIYCNILRRRVHRVMDEIHAKSR